MAEEATETCSCGAKLVYRGTCITGALAQWRENHHHELIPLHRPTTEPLNRQQIGHIIDRALCNAAGHDYLGTIIEVMGVQISRVIVDAFEDAGITVRRPKKAQTGETQHG